MLVFALAVMLGGGFAFEPAQAAPATDMSEAESDPLEDFNRAMFAIHEGIDAVALRPISVVYNAVLPEFVRDGITNILANVASPISFANAILQGEPELAVTVVERFLINSTLGLGGIVDAAAAGGKVARYEDFGQTMAIAGVESGPYIFLPILGPGTPRHLIGRIVDAAMSPWTWIFWTAPLHHSLTPAEATLISARANADEALTSLAETSPDLYASIRSLYLQSRVSAINNGDVDVDELPDIPDIDH